jgi:hypothetical protein
MLTVEEMKSLGKKARKDIQAACTIREILDQDHYNYSDQELLEILEFYSKIKNFVSKQLTSNIYNMLIPSIL